jgi:phage tail-like protein
MPTIKRPNVNPAFRFLVEIDGINEAVFTECSLPAVEWDVLAIKEGGKNEFVHQLPGRRKAANVTLKSGLGTKGLLKWYKSCMSESWNRRKVTVRWLDLTHKEIMNWQLQGAFPTKWAAPSFKTDDTSIALETLVLACEEITVE